MCSFASLDVCRFDLHYTSAHRTVDLICPLRQLCYIWCRLSPLFALSICRSTGARLDVCRLTVFMVDFRHVMGSLYTSQQLVDDRRITGYVLVAREARVWEGTCPRGMMPGGVCPDTVQNSILRSLSRMFTLWITGTKIRLMSGVAEFCVKSWQFV